MFHPTTQKQKKRTSIVFQEAIVKPYPRDDQGIGRTISSTGCPKRETEDACQVSDMFWTGLKHTLDRAWCQTLRGSPGVFLTAETMRSLNIFPRRTRRHACDSAMAALWWMRYKSSFIEERPRPETVTGALQDPPPIHQIKVVHVLLFIVIRIILPKRPFDTPLCTNTHILCTQCYSIGCKHTRSSPGLLS